MKMLFGIRFDLVFSIGEDCGCAMLLSEAGLRDTSSPFDWLTKASFEARIGLLRGRFSGFLQRKNLRILEKPVSGYVDKGNDYYADTATNLYFYHDFKAGLPLEESYPIVKEKYERRIRRLVGRLDKGGNVLMVWWSRNKKVGDDEARTAVEAVQTAYPAAKVCLLLFENDMTARPGQVSKHVASERIVRITGGICPNLVETAGYRPATQKVLKQIRTTYPRQRTAHSFRHAAARFLSLFHLTRDARRAARKCWSERLGA